MRAFAFTGLAFVGVAAVAAAQVPQTFDKHYPIAGHAELEAQIGNGSIKAQSCGGCKDIHIHLEMNHADLSRFHIEESQNGNHVRFVLKQDDHHGWKWNNDGGKGPEMTVEVPEESSLNLASGNGNVALTGVRGDISLSSGNGSIGINNASGQLKLRSGNGSVNGSDLGGVLSADSGNGSIHLSGQFSRLEAHTGNGSIELQAGGPNALRDGANISSGSGTVTLRLSRDAHADVHLSTGSGGIHSDLPLTTQGDVSSYKQDLKGTLNGGGATIKVSTGSGSVRLEGL